jgi:pimeloyl-ACP methyl ester carboxylesterase
MKAAAMATAVIVAAIATGTIIVLLGGGTPAPAARTLSFATPTARPSEVVPTPLPATWLDGLNARYGDGGPLLIACLDNNDDGRLDGVDVRLEDGACANYGAQADYYAGAPSIPERWGCRQSPGPLLIVAVASAGSDLLAPSEGESLGLLNIINQLEAHARERGIATSLILSTAAIFGAEMPQTSMERWLTRELAARLDELPCARAVIIGHSHGGATVTSVAAALDARYADRMLGVLIDRTVALYDRPATEMPARTRLLNFFQLNEGWHGEPIDAPNVSNFDESTERAPVAPSDGGGGLAIVSHKTLDDSRGVQGRIVDAVVEWLR